MQPDRPAGSTLAELGRLFLRLGATAFGGPAAHIAMMEDEVVARRGWLGRAAFTDLLGAANLIPGPNSTELAIHIGRDRGGTRGLLVAGTAFILPAFLIVLALAWAYVRFGTLPAAEALLWGIKPVVVAIVAHALWRLGQTAWASRSTALLGLLALVLAFAGLPEVLVLFGIAGLAAARVWWLARGAEEGEAGPPGALALVGGGGSPFVRLLDALPGPVLASLPVVPYSLAALFGYFLFVGSVLFGSGYVLLALLQATLVEQWGWISQDQLLDAIAIGQVTPGPVFTTATFIGYLLGGVPGAVVATVGIFLPAFLFVWLTAPWIAGLRDAPVPAAFLDGANAAAVALILLVLVQLGQAALGDPLAWLLAAGSLLALARWRLNPAWLVLAGAAAGLARSLVQPG